MTEIATRKKGTAREQLLEIVTHQAQVQGKSLAQYLKELQALVERKGEGSSVVLLSNAGRQALFRNMLNNNVICVGHFR